VFETQSFAAPALIRGGHRKRCRSRLTFEKRGADFTGMRAVLTDDKHRKWIAAYQQRPALMRQERVHNNRLCFFVIFSLAERKALLA